MLHAPVLATPNSDKTFEVVLGACATGIGAMLLQGGKLVALAGICFDQRVFATDQELLAAIIVCCSRGIA